MNPCKTNGDKEPKHRFRQKSQLTSQHWKKNEEVWTKRTMINTLKPYENSGPLLESAVPTPLKDPWYY